MSFRIVFRRFWHGKGTFARIPALRRLTIESLEQRALLSVTATPFSSATQHMTVADLPVAAQQAITAKFTQEGKFTASSGMAANDFGFSVSVSGNTVVVGAPDTTVDSSTAQGAAYVFTESASGWANMNEIAKLTASDGVPGDDFGWSVSISGNTVVVGAPGTTVGYGSQYRGAAYVFTVPSLRLGEHDSDRQTHRVRWRGSGLLWLVGCEQWQYSGGRSGKRNGRWQLRSGGGLRVRGTRLRLDKHDPDR